MNYLTEADHFNISLTGTVVSPPRKSEQGTLFLTVEVITKTGPIYVEIMAQEKAAEIYVSQGDKISVSNGMGFVNRNKESGCSFSVGVKRPLQLNVLSYYDGIKDAKSELI